MTGTFASLFPEAHAELDIQDVVAKLGGRWNVTLADGQVLRSATLTPLGKNIRRNGLPYFAVGSLGVATPETSRRGKMKVVEFSSIASVEKVVVDFEAARARAAARRAAR